jgi:hypothetical protein
MACYYPIPAYRSKENGSISFGISATHTDRLELPCGSCCGCRLEKARIWAMRCAHEASLYDNNMFLTLTYDDEHLPDHGSLRKKDLQDFWKRLRKRFCVYYTDENGDRKCKNPIRYYACGEYGDESERPHYHAICFNLWMDDAEFWKLTPSGNKLYISDTLSEIWGHGFVVIGHVSFESAGYVARYVMKKRTKPNARDEAVREKQQEIYDEAYRRVYIHDDGTHEVVYLDEEFAVMSRRPGIGREWYDLWKDDTYPSDSVVLRGKEMKPPRYYDELIRIEDEELYDQLKRDRLEEAWKHYDDNTTARLDVKRQCAEARVNLYPRSEA